MSSLFSKPKIPKPVQMTPISMPRMAEDEGRAGDSLYKRLAKMFGRQNTVLTGPLGEENQKRLGI